MYDAGYLDEAASLVDSLSRARGPAIRHHALRALIAARRGHRALAMQIADTLATMDGRYAFGGPAYWRARIAAVLGARDEAVALLRESFSRDLRRTPFGASQGAGLRITARISAVCRAAPAPELMPSYPAFDADREDKPYRSASNPASRAFAIRARLSSTCAAM